jgi:ribosomal protein S6--L-glutamate ligase
LQTFPKLAEDRFVILVIGEKDWPTADDVITIELRDTDLIGVRASVNGLHVHDKDGEWAGVSGVIWRGQYDVDLRKEIALLQMIRFAGVPCLNSVDSLLRYGSRIGGYGAMSECGLPVINSDVFIGSKGFSHFYKPNLPVVVKVGDWQSGYGKIRTETQEVWLDVIDIAAVMNDYVCIEPYIDYVRDVRCLLVNDRILGIERIGSRWKANVNPDEMNIVSLPSDISEATLRVARALDANIVGVDWLQSKTGEWKILEANLSPGLHSPRLYDFREEVTNRFRSYINDV